MIDQSLMSFINEKVNLKLIIHKWRIVFLMGEPILTPPPGIQAYIDQTPQWTTTTPMGVVVAAII